MKQLNPSSINVKETVVKKIKSKKFSRKVNFFAEF